VRFLVQVRFWILFFNDGSHIYPSFSDTILVGGAQMSISSLKHRITKRVELEHYKQDFSDVGSFIKRKRKELNVTQDEISSGICSISYLSKIENNQIVPSEFYVKEIMEKLDIDQAIYTKSLRDKEYVGELINAFFYMDEKKIKAIYEDIKDVEHNMVINLCKLGYIVYFNLDDQNQYVMMLEHLVNNMNNVEIQLYLYFASMYFIENEKYKTALELIVLQETLPQQNEYITAMFYEIGYVVKQRLHMKNCAGDDYNQAMNRYTKFHNVQRIMRLAMCKVENIAVEHPKKALAMLKTIKYGLLLSEEQEHFHYLKADILYHLSRYADATLELSYIDEGSMYYLRKMTLLLQICLLEDDDDMVEQIKTKLQSYRPHKKEMRNKVFYHYLLQPTPEDQKEYLRDIAIPFSIKVEDYRLLLQYTRIVMDICTDNSRYKEAMQFYQKYEREMHKVQKILY